MPIVPFGKVSDPAASGHRPTIGVYSLGGAHGSPRQFAQFEFDVSKMRDPAGQQQFRGKTGLVLEVQTWMRADSRIDLVVKECKLLADDLVKPKALTEATTTRVVPASTWLSFAFKDHHGRWAAPAVAEIVAKALSDAGYTVAIFHRELKDAVQ